MTYLKLLEQLPTPLPKIFIETGTHVGSGTRQFSPHFEKVYTIELSPSLSQIAMENNKDLTNIEYFVGESHVVLPIVLEKISDDFILFLDAHGSGGDTVYSEQIGRFGSPVIKELNACVNKLPKIVVIDDLSDFENIPSYPNPLDLNNYLYSLGYTDIKDVRYKKGWKIALR